MSRSVAALAGFVSALLANDTLVADLAGRPIGRAPPPDVLAAAEAAGLNVANLVGAKRIISLLFPIYMTVLR